MPAYSEQWEKVSRSAAAIERIDKLAEREQYVFIYRTATIGGSDEAAIQVPSAGPNKIPARILNLGGGFWLEGLMPETATFVNGQPVAKRELVPLAPGDRLSFGVMELTFQEFGQIRM
jgi:pSer/pThr/pTyr-binding forkhead associated (FHA) protein